MSPLWKWRLLADTITPRREATKRSRVVKMMLAKVKMMLAKVKMMLTMVKVMLAKVKMMLTMVKVMLAKVTRSIFEITNYHLSCRPEEEILRHKGQVMI